MPGRPDTRALRLAGLGLLAVTGVAIAFGNGASRALDGHEILVAETATQMLERGDYWIPRFNDRPRLEKPPGAYWLSLAAHALDGSQSRVVGEWAARLPELLAGLLLVGLTFALARAAFGRPRAALVAAALFASCWDFFRYARSARPEMLYALFCGVEMLGIVLAARLAQRGEAPTRARLLAAAGLCGALLAKGPQIPLFLLLAAAGASLLPVRHGRSLRAVFSGWLLVGLLPPLVYFGALALQVDGAPALWRQEILQDEPYPLLLRPLRLYFPAALGVGFLPWLPLAVLAAVSGWRRRRDPAVALLWSAVLVSLFFLGFSGKLRHHYVLPLVPLLATLSAGALSDLWDASRTDASARRWLRRLTLAQAAFLAAFGIGVGVAVAHPHPEDGRFLLGWLLPFLAAAAGVVAWGWRRQRAYPGQALGAAVLAMMVVWTGVAVTGGDVSVRWTRGKQFALEVAHAVAPAREVLLDAGQREPLVYYGRLRTRPWYIKRYLDSGSLPPGARAPVWVSRRKRLAALGLEGEVRVAQPEDSRDGMVLFRPAARPSGAGASPGSEATAGPGTSSP